MATSITTTSLSEITGHESGLIIWDNGETWVLNWAIYDGMPQQLGPLTIGLGERIMSRPIRVPAGALAVVRAHEAANDGAAVSRSTDLRAWRINDDATVIVSRNWA